MNQKLHVHILDQTGKQLSRIELEHQDSPIGAAFRAVESLKKEFQSKRESYDIHDIAIGQTKVITSSDLAKVRAAVSMYKKRHGGDFQCKAMSSTKLQVKRIA